MREAHSQDELAGAGTRDGAALVVRERAAAFNAHVTKSYFPITAIQLYYCITLLYEVSDGKVCTNMSKENRGEGRSVFGEWPISGHIFYMSAISHN